MVITNVNQAVYQGDGVTTAFPFTFRIIDDTDIKLLLLDSDGTETDITSDYYVDTVNNTVHYPGYAPGAEPALSDRPPVLAEGQKLVIYRKLPITQEKDLGDKWPFFVIELALDKLTMLIQDAYGWAGQRFMKKSDGANAWDARNFPINNVGGPVNVNDAATKDYVDRILNGIILEGDTVVVPFDTVSQMRSADLEASQVAFTLGYNDISDGGFAVYTIRPAVPGDVDDGGSIIFLDNGNVAELITDGVINVKQFGAKGDGVTDDTDAFKNALAYSANMMFVVPEGDYVITENVFGDGVKDVIDKGTYTDIKPFYYVKPDLFKGFDHVEPVAFTDILPMTYPNATQGICYDTKRERYVISNVVSPSAGYLWAINKSTYAVEQISSPYAYGHCTSLTYKEDTDQIIVVYGEPSLLDPDLLKTIYFVNADTLAVDDSLVLDVNLWTLCWDDVCKVYYVLGEEDAKVCIYIKDKEFNTLRRFFLPALFTINDLFHVQALIAKGGNITLFCTCGVLNFNIFGDYNSISHNLREEIEGATFGVDGNIYMIANSTYKNYKMYVHKDEAQSWKSIYPATIDSAVKYEDIDIDELVESGTYYVTFTDQSLNKFPVDSYCEQFTEGVIRVIRNSLNNGLDVGTCCQTAYLFNANYGYDIYVRYQKSNYWVSWKRLATTGASDTLFMKRGTIDSGIAFTVGYKDVDRTVNPGAADGSYVLFLQDKNGLGLGGIYRDVSVNGVSNLRIYSNWKSYSSGVMIGTDGSGNKRFIPNEDNETMLGAPAARWEEVYAGTGTINTSDERLKDNITNLSDEVLDAWGDVKWYQFQFKDAIADKGESARIHVGTIAQRVKEVFETHGLDAFRYGLLCYDEWEAEEEIKDENGNVIQEAKEAGNRYALRYEEALCMEAAYQRRRADKLEARIQALEDAIKI